MRTIGSRFGFCAAHRVEREVQRQFEYLPIEEEQGAERLVLRGGSNAFLYGQVGEESLDLGSAQVFGITFAVEQKVAFDPLDVGLLSIIGVVFEPERIPDLIQQQG